MSPRTVQHEGRKDRTAGRPLRQVESDADAIADEIAESLIETFPASDPP
jgi:hypothetical protein